MFRFIFLVDKNAGAMFIVVVFWGMIVVKKSRPILVVWESHGVGIYPRFLEANDR